MKIFKIPYSAGALSKKSGIEQAPDKIVSLLDEFFLSEGYKLPFVEIFEIEIDNYNIEQSHKKIFEALKNQDSCIILGGDHSITFSAFKGFSEHQNRKNKNNGIIIFDAHPDLMNSEKTHEDYLRNLIEQGFLKKENIILVGVRNSDKEESDFIIKNKIKNYSMKEISFEGKDQVCDAIMSVARNWHNIYLSIDIDVVDPAFAPGTGYCEPGGLTSRELLYFLQRLKLLNKIKMIDIVEINPEKDSNNMTSKLAAKIVFEVSG